MWQKAFVSANVSPLIALSIVSKTKINKNEIYFKRKKNEKKKRDERRMAKCVRSIFTARVCMAVCA